MPSKGNETCLSNNTRCESRHIVGAAGQHVCVISMNVFMLSIAYDFLVVAPVVVALGNIVTGAVGQAVAGSGGGGGSSREQKRGQGSIISTTSTSSRQQLLSLNQSGSDGGNGSGKSKSSEVSNHNVVLHSVVLQTVSEV